MTTKLLEQAQQLAAYIDALPEELRNKVSHGHVFCSQFANHKPSVSFCGNRSNGREMASAIAPNGKWLRKEWCGSFQWVTEIDGIEVAIDDAEPLPSQSYPREVHL